jgi:hypothetical protein
MLSNIVPYVLTKDTLTVQKEALGIQHHMVIRVCEYIGNLPGSFQSTELEKTFVLAHRFSYQFCAACFTLRSNNDRLNENERRAKREI